MSTVLCENCFFIRSDRLGWYLRYKCNTKILMIVIKRIAAEHININCEMLVCLYQYLTENTAIFKNNPHVAGLDC